ncbi:hypothetical protein BKA70DRAFT_1301278 [Coprinopsis sp. MPI-PUGE-AT-0042]|nr:hypothetical protein BKA70DRAFT_1301278 [Coprinopsis sp. MPI-PUGE-AT-0042]
MQGQSQGSGTFPDASTVIISHSILNDMSGDSHTYYNSYTYNVFNAPSPQDARRCYPTVAPADRASLPIQPHNITFSDGTPINLSKPNLFPVIENTLELIAHLVGSPAGSANIFHRISPDLQELVQLVSFSSTAYSACNGQSPIGQLIQTAIDSGLSVCNRRLVALHQELVILPHRSVPLVRSVCRTIYQWWTANEPEEITHIRSKLKAETMVFAEWLACLKSLYWASHVLFTAKNTFSWKDIEQFFTSGPILLKEMHVDKIIIIEPLQGDYLSVPIRFIASFEDVHQVVQVACQGTVGARFIEARRYQLDDSETNELVDPSRFAEGCLQDGKAFEVAMKLVRREHVVLNVCPRCAYCHQDGEDKINGWIRCLGCKTQFNAHISRVRTARQEEVGRRDSLNAWTEIPAEADVPHHAQHPSDTQRTFMMFRRLIIEILEASEASVGSVSSSESTTGLWRETGERDTSEQEQGRDDDLRRMEEYDRKRKDNEREQIELAKRRREHLAAQQRAWQEGVARREHQGEEQAREQRANRKLEGAPTELGSEQVPRVPPLAGDWSRSLYS